MRIIETEDFSVDLEYTDTYAIVHLPEVRKFNKSVYLDLKICAEDLFEFLTTVGYQNMFAAVNDHTIEKLAKKLGFVYIGEQDNLKIYAYKELTVCHQH